MSLQWIEWLCVTTITDIQAMKSTIDLNTVFVKAFK